MTRILHVLSSNRLSGAENVAADICMLFKNEYEMAYLSPDGPIKKSLDDRGIHFIPIKNMSLSEVKKAIKIYKPDIIHAHDVKATILSVINAGKIPIISHLHGNNDNMKKIKLKSILYLLTSFRVKKIIIVSKSILEDFIFKDFIKEKSLYLRNIIYKRRVELLLDKDTNEYDFDFSYIGRISYEKDPQRVAKVASKVLKLLPSAKFSVIGTGDLIDNMRKIFVDEGVYNRVMFTGVLPYPYKALKQSKCILMCSKFEGTPITAIEAMSLGVPIVSTPTDGMVDLVENEKTGFLSNEDKALTQAIVKLIKDNNLRSVLSKYSIDRFKRLNDESVYKNQLDKIYQQVIDPKRDQR